MSSFYRPSTKMSGRRQPGASTRSARFGDQDEEDARPPSSPRSTKRAQQMPQSIKEDSVLDQQAGLPTSHGEQVSNIEQKNVASSGIPEDWMPPEEYRAALEAQQQFDSQHRAAACDCPSESGDSQSFAQEVPWTLQTEDRARAMAKSQRTIIDHTASPPSKGNHTQRFAEEVPWTLPPEDRARRVSSQVHDKTSWNNNNMSRRQSNISTNLPNSMEQARHSLAQENTVAVGMLDDEAAYHATVAYANEATADEELMRAPTGAFAVSDQGNRVVRRTVDGQQSDQDTFVSNSALTFYSKDSDQREQSNSRVQVVADAVVAESNAALQERVDALQAQVDQMNQRPDNSGDPAPIVDAQEVIDNGSGKRNRRLLISLILVVVVGVAVAVGVTLGIDNNSGSSPSQAGRTPTASSAAQPESRPTSRPTLTPTPQPTPAPSQGPREAPVTINILTDRFPEEISWFLLDSSGGTVDSAPTGTYRGEPSSLFTTQLNLVIGAQFTFVIEDAANDGICCLYGNGEYYIEAHGVVLFSGGAFTSSESTAFVVPPP